MSAVRVFPFAGDGKWYWQDADCDEAMGPFDSYRDAWRDHKALRAPMSRSIATGECNERFRHAAQ